MKSTAPSTALTPQRAPHVPALVRCVCPDVEVGLAGGREAHPRSLQPPYVIDDEDVARICAAVPATVAAG